MGWERTGTCGTCREFEYEGSNSKGYCRYYRAYYWPDDSCRHYEEGSSSHGGSGCFLTTACCDHKGLPDNCRELQRMRRFRDEQLKAMPNGRKIIEIYYRDAPGIVSAINAHPDKDAIYEDIYRQILEILELVEQGKDEQAVIAYMLMTYEAARKAGGRT